MMYQIMGITLAKISKSNNYDHVSVNECIRRYGDEAVNALLSESRKVHTHDTFEPLNIDKLSTEAKHEALDLIIMIKGKTLWEYKGKSLCWWENSVQLY